MPGPAAVAPFDRCSAGTVFEPTGRHDTWLDELPGDRDPCSAREPATTSRRPTGPVSTAPVAVDLSARSRTAAPNDTPSSTVPVAKQAAGAALRKQPLSSIPPPSNATYAAKAVLFLKTAFTSPAAYRQCLVTAPSSQRLWRPITSSSNDAFINNRTRPFRLEQLNEPGKGLAGGLGLLRRPYQRDQCVPDLPSVREGLIKLGCDQ